MLSKLEEKEMLRRFVATCPTGYVRDIIGGVQLEIENAIDSDFGFIDFSARRREIEEHRQEMIAARKELDAVKAQIREAERVHARLDHAINELRSTIRQFAKL